MAHIPSGDTATLELLTFADALKAANTPSDEYDIEKPKSDVHDYYRNFVKAIDGEAEQMVTHDQMRCILKVIMTAFESVENGGNKIYW